MGLDSVELLMEVENYFRIQIPDPEAEKISMVQDMVNVVALHLDITTSDKTLQDKVFENVSFHIRQITNSDYLFHLEDKVSNYLLAEDKEKWQTLERLLGLSVPRPDSFDPKSNKLSSKFKKLINWTPNYDWHVISFEQFVDAICSNNYQTLLDPSNIRSKYEIYVGVIGITVDKIGVDYFEISPHKSFTSDLGVD